MAGDGIKNNDWTSALIRDHRTIHDAVELLTANSLRIVLVVDEHKRLQGTVTDGDIRRALISGYDLSSEITSIMHVNPTTTTSTVSRRTALNTMRDLDLLHLPVLDESGVVVGLESIRDFLLEQKRPNPVLLMAGGFGKRLYALTRNLPKPLLPIGDKPILEGIVQQLSDEGFVDFFIAVHYHKELIQEYFEDGSNWGVNIQYLEEEEPLGTAGALALLDASKLTHSLVVMNGDLVTRLNFGELLNFHDKNHADATLCVRDYQFEVPYGVITGEGIDVQDIVEKPVQSFLINAGIYVVEPSVVEVCQETQYRDMPDVLRQVLNSGGSVNRFPVHEYWVDIGGTSEYERAQAEVRSDD